MEQSVHRPLSQSGLPIVRRVNSAIGERVGLDLLRRPRRPVVTDSSIDPSTRPHPELPPCHAPSRACATRSRGGTARGSCRCAKEKRPCTSCRGPIPRVDTWAFPRGVYANANCLRTTAGVYHAVYQPQAIAVLAKRCRSHRLISCAISSSAAADFYTTQ